MANMHEKMLNNISHQEYASQNYSEIPCHNCQYGYYQKDSGWTYRENGALISC